MPAARLTGTRPATGEERLLLVVPLTLALIVLLLYANTRSLVKTCIVLLYLELAWAQARREGRCRTLAELQQVILEGAVTGCVRSS